MRPYVEPARGKPIRDNSEQAQSSHVNLRIQGEHEQSPESGGPGKDHIDKVVGSRVSKPK